MCGRPSPRRAPFCWAGRENDGVLVSHPPQTTLAPLGELTQQKQNPIILFGLVSQTFVCFGIQTAERNIQPLQEPLPRSRLPPF